MTIQVADNPGASRYEAVVDGDIAGFAMYRVENGNTVFFHTEVDPSHEGEGVGTALVTTALGEMRDQGRPVVPMCPFFARYIRRHPEWQDVLTPELKARFARAR